MNKIDSIRKRKRLSYGKIGQACGLSPTYVYLLAKGKRSNPSLETMQKVSSALGEKVEKVFSINSKSEREVC